MVKYLALFYQIHGLYLRKRRGTVDFHIKIEKYA